jgi:hypothetical protein
MRFLEAAMPNLYRRLGKLGSAADGCEPAGAALPRLAGVLETEDRTVT